MMCHSAFDNIIRTEILQRKAGFNQGSKHVSKRELFHKFAKKKKRFCFVIMDYCVLIDGQKVNLIHFKL